MRNSATRPPVLLSRINERTVLQLIQDRGPLSRADLARLSGLSAPTASRAVEALLRYGWLEEVDACEPSRGRPARRVRLVASGTQILGLVLDAGKCRMVAAGLDGIILEDQVREFPTPGTYDALIDASEAAALTLMNRPGVSTLGIGISMPGLLDSRLRRGVLSPNLPVTDRQAPADDLAERLGLAASLAQESHALCLAERRFGAARGLDDFAMMDVATGVGLGIVSGGRLLTGNSGLAGELGHITVQAGGGRSCGCGNAGCLETVASDTALALMVSERLGRALTIDQVVDLANRDPGVVDAELNEVLGYLAIGIGAVINLFNPSTLFVHGRMFAAGGDVFDRLLAETQRRTLPPTYSDCRIVQARGSKRQGAIAAILEHLTEAVAPHYPPTSASTSLPLAEARAFAVAG